MVVLLENFEVIQVDGLKYTQCITCKAKFKTFNRFSAHVRSFLNTNLNFKCNFCCERRKTKPNLAKHVTDRHQTGVMGDDTDKHQTGVMGDEITNESIPNSTPAPDLTESDSGDNATQSTAAASRDSPCSSGESKSQRRSMNNIGLSNKRKNDNAAGSKEGQPTCSKQPRVSNIKGHSWIIDTWTLDMDLMQKDEYLEKTMTEILCGQTLSNTEKLMLCDFAKQAEDAVGQLSMLICVTLCNQLDVREVIKFYEITEKSSASLPIKELCFLLAKHKCEACINEIFRDKIKVPGNIRRQMSLRNQQDLVNQSFPVEIMNLVLVPISPSYQGTHLDKKCTGQLRQQVWARIFYNWICNKGLINEALLNKSALIKCKLGIFNQAVKFIVKNGSTCSIFYVHKGILEYNFAQKCKFDEVKATCKRYISSDMILGLLYNNTSLCDLKLKLTEEIVDIILAIPVTNESKVKFLFKDDNLELFFKPNQKTLLFKTIISLRLIEKYWPLLKNIIEKVINAEYSNSVRTLSLADLEYLIHDKNLNLTPFTKYKLIILWCCNEDSVIFEDIQADDESLKKFETAKHIIMPSCKNLVDFKDTLFIQGFIDISILL